jgi:hypothetical protein
VEEKSILSLKKKRGKINEKEKKMRKKIMGIMGAGILALSLSLVSTPGKAQLSLGVLGGY